MTGKLWSNQRVAHQTTCANIANAYDDTHWYSDSNNNVSSNWWLERFKRKLYGWQVYEERLLELWPQAYYPRLQVEGDVAGATTRGVCPHAPVNIMVFFLCYSFIKIMYINKILRKTSLQFLYITCYNVNYFVSQPVGLDYTSGPGFC